MTARLPLFLLLAAAGAMLAAAPALGATHVTSPKRGEYIGSTRQDHELVLDVAHGRVSRITFEYDCSFAAGRATVRRIKLKRTKKGYAFSFKGRRTVTYSDGRPAQKAALTISGRFGRSGKTVRGRVRARSQRCGSGTIRWSAARASHPVKVPQSGQYAGQSAQMRQIALFTSGRTIDLASIAVSCADTSGQTSLNDFPLRLTRRGYAFTIHAHSSVSYGDDHPDENAVVDLVGHFNPAGTRASGYARVKAPHCGDTGHVSFVLKRQSGSG